MTKNINNKINELVHLCKTELSNNVSRVEIIIKPNDFDITIKQIPIEKVGEMNISGKEAGFSQTDSYVKFQINSSL